MKINRLTVIILLVTGFSLPFFAQNTVTGIPSHRSAKDEETDKRIALQTRVAEQLLYDLEKLPPDENRAFVLAKAGQYLCQTDKMRAEKIFERAVKELLIAQNKAKKPVGDENGELYYGHAPRLTMIGSISQCDAELGYAYLQKTRPRSMSDLIEAFYKGRVSFEERSRETGHLRSELVQENLLKVTVSKKNPARAAEFIRQDLKNHINFWTIDLLVELYKTDPALANQLTEEAIGKLLQLDFFDPQNKKPIEAELGYKYDVASLFLSPWNKPYKDYPMQVSRESLINLADKLSRDMLDNGVYSLGGFGLETIEKFFPDRVKQIRQLATEQRKNSEGEKLINFLKKSPSLEKVLDRAEDFSPWYQKRLFNHTACLMVYDGNFTDARNLITKKWENKKLADHELDKIFYSAAWSFAGENFDFAIEIVDQISSSDLRTEARALLAGGLFEQNPQANRQKALAILTETRKKLDSDPEIENRLAGMDNILSVYRFIDEEAAFRMFDLLIDQTNEIEGKVEAIDAYSTGRSSARLGFRKTVSALKKRDFSRTLDIINKLHRNGAKINTKLALLEERAFYEYEHIFSSFPQPCSV
ncbi:MAG: hypothetical protein R2747_10320 [Pyrinomonadaceae bacterium]